MYHPQNAPSPPDMCCHATLTHASLLQTTQRIYDAAAGNLPAFLSTAL